MNFSKRFFQNFKNFKRRFNLRGDSFSTTYEKTPIIGIGHTINFEDNLVFFQNLPALEDLQRIWSKMMSFSFCSKSQKYFFSLDLEWHFPVLDNIGELFRRIYSFQIFDKYFRLVMGEVSHIFII